MRQTSARFERNAEAALLDADLREAMGMLKSGFVAKRRAAFDELPEFETLRAEARGIKEHTLANLDFYLERFEREATAAGA